MPDDQRQVEARRSSAGAWLYLVVGLVAVLPFVTGFGNGFVFDDQGLVLDNPAVWSPSFWTPWLSRYWPESEAAGLYRPLTTFSFWLDGRIWGKAPQGFFATNLVLHALVCLLLLSCLRALFPCRRWLTLATALIYSVHPLHSEAVVGIVGRAELLAALGSLGAYRSGLLFLRPGARGGRNAMWGLLSALGLLFGLLAKESATGIILLLAFHLWRPAEAGEAGGKGGEGSAAEGRAGQLRVGGGDRRPVMLLGLLWGTAVSIALLARIRILGSLVGLGAISQIDNVLAHVGTIDRILTALFVQAWVLWQLAWPATLSPDYSYPEIVPSTGHGWIGAIYGATAVTLVVRSVYRRDRELLWGATFCLATGLLTSNVVFAIGTVYGERLAYLPSAGFLWILTVLVARGLARLAPKPAAPEAAAGDPRPTAEPRPFAPQAGDRGNSVLGFRLGGLLLIAAVIALGVRSAVRAPEWRTNVTLFESASRAADRSAKVWTNLGLARLKEGDIEGGLAAADRAIELYPEYPAAVQAKGSALVQMGRPEEAIPWLERNVRLEGTRGLDALLELGNAQLALGDGAAALGFFHEARTRAKETDERWMVGLASAHALGSNWSESRRYWQNAVSIRPEDPAFRQRYAYVLWQNDEQEEAEKVYRALVSEAPSDPERNNELAWFLAVTGRAPEEALALAQSAYELGPDANIADTWLEAWVKARGCDAARAWLTSSAETFPNETREKLKEAWSQRCASEDGTNDDQRRTDVDKGGSK